MPGSGGCGRLSKWGLLEDDMGIGADDAKGPHAGGARSRVGLPLSQLFIDVKRTVGKIDLRIGPLEMQAGGQQPVFEGQNGLDETGNASSGIEMAEIRLHRADGAE